MKNRRGKFLLIICLLCFLAVVESYAGINVNPDSIIIPTPKPTPAPTSAIIGSPIIVYPPYNKIEDVLFPPQVIDDKGQVYYRFLAVPKK